MKLDLTMIAKSINQELVREILFESPSFRSRMGDFPVTRREPVVLHICNQENESLRISGEAEFEAEIPCSRCLKEVRTPIRFTIDRTFRIREDALADDEMEELDYLIGFTLDAEKFLCAEILVNWPMKVLCREDCRGICKVCGMNLNEGACSCQKTELDPRMAAIQDIFHKFKEV